MSGENLEFRIWAESHTVEAHLRPFKIDEIRRAGARKNRRRTASTSRIFSGEAQGDRDFKRSLTL